MPKPIRDRLGLHGGEALEVEERDGVIEVRPAATEAKLVETPESPVAERLERIAPLTHELVREVLERARR